VSAEKEGIPQLAQIDDNRLTKVCKFLREHHLDELPQLWNVFVGEMSFVGYRPERKYFIDKIIEHNPDYVLLYVSRPGVTSNATLYNGYTDTMEKMLRRLDMDLDYLRNRSIMLDFKIILVTILSVTSGMKI
jgi:lipopolysaccharide/colanic/teichoic acid biosynthesis glycosyltransferase